MRLNDTEECSGDEYRHQLVQILFAAGWDAKETAAVLQCLSNTYDNENEYDYTSDLRLARVSNAEEMAQYEAIKAAGCCGDFDETLDVILSDGSKSTIMIGFNYGH